MSIKYGATVQLKGNRVTEAHEFDTREQRDLFIKSVEKLSIVDKVRIFNHYYPKD
jgi:hypothetical protein